MSINQSKILITGGAGFLGSHLTERLLREGNDVLVVDNFFTGNKQNLAHLMGNPNLEIMRHDVTFPLYVEVNQIYNLACPASPVHYQYDPVQTTKTSVHGVINMLGLAKRTRARILQASTSEVYGDPEVHPQPEGYWGRVNPIGIRSCYDEGKRCAETLFFAANTINLLDRQVLGILASDLQKKIGWNEIQYGYIVSAFQLSYAIGMAVVGRILDSIGTRLGYTLTILLWSLASMAHAFVGTPMGFGLARVFLGLSESGNFPAAIKATSEWFPAHERSIVAGIINAGSNMGVIVAALLVPFLTIQFGWQATIS